MAKQFDPKRFLARFRKMNRALACAGFHALSGYWDREAERFVHALAAGRDGAVRTILRRWIIRAGRRAGKSSFLCRLAVAWALWGAWHVPLGDTPVVAFISVSLSESTSRTRTIAEILRTLGIDFDQRDGEILMGGRVLFKSFAANTKATVGFTAIAIFGDEVARWEHRDSSANPAAEVFAGLWPTLASQEYGFSVLSSSPWGSEDFHAQLYHDGDTAHQIVSFAPTWIANPTISEENTRELEPNEQIRLREYGAEEGKNESAALPAEVALPCFGRVAIGEPAFHFVAIDASSLRGDVFSIASGHTTGAGELVISEVFGWDAVALRGATMSDVVDDVARAARQTGASRVFGDQREEASLSAMFAERGIGFTSYAWSEPSKESAMQWLRREMHHGNICLPEHAELKSQILGLKARLAPSGRTHYATNGKDYVSALITAAHAAINHDIPFHLVDRSNIDLFDEELNLYTRWSGVEGRGF